MQDKIPVPPVPPPQPRPPRSLVSFITAGSGATGGAVLGAGIGALVGGVGGPVGAALGFAVGATIGAAGGRTIARALEKRAARKYKEKVHAAGTHAVTAMTNVSKNLEELDKALNKQASDFKLDTFTNKEKKLFKKYDKYKCKMIEAAHRNGLTASQLRKNQNTPTPAAGPSTIDQAPEIITLQQKLDEIKLELHKQEMKRLVKGTAEEIKSIEVPEDREKAREDFFKPRPKFRK